MTTNFSFADGYWMAERALITIKDATQNGDVRLRVQVIRYPGRPWITQIDATYTADDSGNLVIDVSDALRMYKNMLGVRVRVKDIEQAAETMQKVQIMGLVNPSKLLMPKSPNLSSQNGQIIMPPQRMLQVLDTVAECYFSQPSLFTIANVDDGEFVDENNRAIQFHDRLQIARNGTIVAEYQVEQVANQCRLYAVVEWVSMTGVLRKHTFWVIKPEIEVADKYDLLTNDNSYKEIKGNEDGCTLMIDGLNAYDIWYYSDLAMSSNVRVEIHNGAGYSVGLMPALITTKKVTIPDGDGGKLGSVEFECKYKRYDAVAM